MSIISASRRTDIPAFYSSWFAERLQEEYVLIRNTGKKNEVERIELTPNTVDCIVLWTKNPKKMIDNGSLKILNQSKIPYYFQFTLTGYEDDLERFKRTHPVEELIETFQQLYEEGNENIIWRYDPIIYTQKYNADMHLEMFERIADEIKMYTNRCVLSYVDMYSNVEKEMEDVIRTIRTEEDNEYFLSELSKTALKYGIELVTCSESVNLEKYRIKHGKCIDDKYIERITGKRVSVKKDKAQRKNCGCVESIDIGTYGTCMNLCKYCYAYKGLHKAQECQKAYNIYKHSPLFCDELKAKDVIKKRVMNSIFVDENEETKDDSVQLSFW